MTNYLPTLVRTSNELALGTVATKTLGTLEVRWANRYDIAPVIVQHLVDGVPEAAPEALQIAFDSAEDAYLAIDRVDVGAQR